jgi:DNA-binding transcriptional ArsR family regulator
MSENVIVLEPGDERATKVAKAIGSPIAGDILRFLGEGETSVSDITERLSIPFNTAKYHIDNLVDAGLISVVDTKYSVKGREVKIYSLTNQVLIVAPPKSNVRDLILKYASLFVIVIVGALGITLVSPLLLSTGAWNTGAVQAPVPAVDREMVGVMAAKSAYGSEPIGGPLFPEPALAFFLGGVLVIIVLVLYEIYLLKKEKVR